MNTVVELSERRPPAEQWPASAEERRAAAVEYARAELAGGRSPTGADLQRRCGVSERTGRRIMKELTSAATTGHADRPSGRSATNGQAATTGHGRDRSASTGHGQTSTVAGQRPAANGQGDRSPAIGQRPQSDRPAAGGRPSTAGRQSGRPAANRQAVTPAADQPTATDRGTWARRWWGRNESRVITWVVGFAAAAQSVGHMHEVAVMAGQKGWIAWLWPVSVDGLVYAALRRNSRYWVVVGLAVSVAANVLTHYPEVVESVAWAISAWPPIALLGTHWLLHRGRTKEAITS